MKKHLLRSIFFPLLLLAGNWVFAQTRTINGTVTSKENGFPIAGVTVIVKVLR